MTRLLYIDTSAAVATVALSSGGVLSAMRTHENAQEQAAAIHLMIEDVLEQAGTHMQQIDAFCVCGGPGSYTGLRVGLSAAKGMAYATGKTLMLFNKLDLLSWQNERPSSRYVIALKARAGEYFAALFNEDGTPAAAPRHAFEADLQEYASEGYHFLTDDAEFGIAAPHARIVSDRITDIGPWIAKATERFEKGLFDDLAYSEPFYLKAAYTTQSKK